MMRTNAACTMWIWALLPVLLAAFAIGGIWAVFSMAVVNGSVNITVEFPYISVCGAEPPQSCLFAQIMNIGAFLVTWVCVIRYQQVVDYGSQSSLNIVSLVAGCLCALGGTLVGNFQQMPALHSALDHLKSSNSYIRRLFIDYSSAFNPIIPSELVKKLQTLDLCNPLCNWIFDFLIGRPQSVRIGNNVSSSLIINRGAPQVYVLSSLLTMLTEHPRLCRQAQFQCYLQVC
ncbi:modulator of macroautophagy TMEM150B isoform X4 [Narcine bancroftii]|uniref:modulator of macroautophagy TMEM150B isoform X4 n=1 Tax=Narcine bancroftii TaxID=1343680 RepID=UPI00383118E8